MNNDIIYIFGHRHPDTDSICSSIAYADLKCKMGLNAEARRLGEINKETAFILDYFNLPVPPLLESIKTQVSDLQIDCLEKLSPNTTIKRAWSLMENSNISSTLPVVDDNEKLIGLVSLSDITKKYMDVFNYNAITSCGTSLENICETINADVLCGEENWFNSTGKVTVATGTAKNLSEYIEPGDIVVVGDREDSQRASIELGAKCIIVTCGHKPDDDVIELAKGSNTIVLTTPLDTYTAVRLINQSIPVGSIMCKSDKIVCFHVNDFVENIKDSMIKHRYRSYPVLDNDDKICGFISRFHLISQRKKRVILVDHNEKSQTCPGIEEAEVMEIIDHHKVGDMTTTSPILFKNEPVGSTATIIANMFIEQGRRPSTQIAGILCAAIISDTLKFQSPTCTDFDRKTADKLAAIANIQIDEFAEKMFTAGSELKGKTPREMYAQDFKRVSFNDYHCGVSQVTILNMDYIAEEKPQIIEYMNKACVDDKFDLLALMITELSTRKTEIWVTGALAPHVMKEMNAEESGNRAVFNRLMSRKKDVIPLIDSAIEKLNL